MTTEPLRLRHEVKHQLSPQEDLVLTSRLGKLFPRDGHAGPDGSYRVTSLYFDTPYDTALREKLDGVNRREKFRLRYYGERPDFLKLEKKWKVNGLCGKRSARLTWSEAERLLSALPSLEVEQCGNWNKRYRDNLVRMKSGDLYEVARVIKCLMTRGSRRGLSTGERKMLHTARQILLSELVLSEQGPYEEVEARVDRAILGVPQIQ